MKQSRNLVVIAVCALIFGSCQKDMQGSQAFESQATADLMADESKHVYVLSNQADGNEVLVFDKASDGKLKFKKGYATGGMGTGAGLGSQGALIIAKEKGLVLAVNAGDNTISCLQVTNQGLKELSTVPSGGVMPVSATHYRNMIYVLNAGGTGNICGFKLDGKGMLQVIPNSVKPLSSSAAGGAQISFVQQGKVLVVTEKATNSITSWRMNDDGTPGNMYNVASANATPFGFAVGRNNIIYVSEAAGGAPNASTLSSYYVGANGMVRLITGPVMANQSAACWVVLTKNGKYAYTTNTASNNISSFMTNFIGKVTVAEAIAADGGMAPIDAAISSDGKYLYVLNSASKDIGAYSVAEDGTLKNIQFAGGLPTGAVGMATD